MSYQFQKYEDGQRNLDCFILVRCMIQYRRYQLPFKTNIRFFQRVHHDGLGPKKEMQCITYIKYQSVS